jgi:glycosyltransferase involved in cell wall biosynthesis
VNIGFVLVNTGRKGGAEKRFFNIMNLLKDYHRVCLLTNSSLADFARELGFNWGKLSVEILVDDLSPGRRPEEPRKEGQRKGEAGLIRRAAKRLVRKKWRGLLAEFFEILRYNRRVFLWAKRNRLEVINSLQPSGIFTLAAQVFGGARTVFSYVDYEVFNGYPFRWVTNMGLKTVFRFAAEYDFLSAMIPRAIEAKGLRLDPNKVNIAPNSFIDWQRISPQEKDPRMVVFSGRMERIKSPFLALEAALLLKQKGVPFNLEVLGRGSVDQEIKKFIKCHNLADQVHFYFEPQIERILSRASIYLSLQDGNNYPSQALLEAMASGCAVIATRVGETWKLVDGEVGFLVDKDPRDVAAKLEVLLFDFARARKFGNRARERVIQIHTPDNYIRYLLSVYQKALA